MNFLSPPAPDAVQASHSCGHGHCSTHTPLMLLEQFILKRGKNAMESIRNGVKNGQNSGALRIICVSEHAHGTERLRVRVYVCACSETQVVPKQNHPIINTAINDAGCYMIQLGSPGLDTNSSPIHLLGRLPGSLCARDLPTETLTAHCDRQVMLEAVLGHTQEQPVQLRWPL